MPKCKNDPIRSYKGNEPSPKGLGYCAHAEKLNKKKKGKDGNMWIVSETSKGVKRWIILKKEKKNSKPPQTISNLIDYDLYWGFKDIKPNKINNYTKNNKFIMKIFNNIVPSIKKKIKFYTILLPPNQKNHYWSDYYSYYLDKYYPNWDKFSNIIMTIYLNNDLSINDDYIINIQYSLTLDEQKFIYKLFSEKLPYNYRWSGLSSDIMKIYYKKQKTKVKKINIKPLKQFPMIYGYIDLEKIKKTDSIILYENNPFKDSKELKDIWNQIDKKFNVVDSGWSSTDISFKVYDVNDIKLFKKIKKIKKLTLKNTIFNIKKISISYYKTGDESDSIDL